MNRPNFFGDLFFIKVGREREKERERERERERPW